MCSLKPYISSKSVFALLVLLLFMFTLFPSFSPPGKAQVAVAYSIGNAQQTTYQIIQHPLPNGSTEPWAIAADSAGRAWFVEQGSNQLGMLDPTTGNISEYSIPTPNSTAISVAVDSLGNVWFTELAGNRLGELKNGSTSIIEHPVPGAPYQIAGHTQFQSCGPSGVVPDSSGHIWVICEFSNQIDEYFPNNGTFLSFDLPVYQSGPAGLVFDHQGNFWFTASDAEMLGHGIVSELQNGTTNGISEFPPSNQTYSFTVEHALGPLGPNQNYTSSLPSPSGIALAPDGNTLWITEHVDSSFDSYNIQSKSLDRYWTSKTNDAFGFPFSFPNGVAVDKQGNVWISEHYGNKIAEFNPSTDQLTEYIVPCCGGGSAGTYTLTLGNNGTVWFVEIAGNAIGELKSVPGNQTFSLSLGSSIANLGSSGSTNIPVNISVVGSGNSNVTLDISGISRTGNLSKASALFSPAKFQISGTENASSGLTLNTNGLGPGTYYLTVSATVYPQNVIYSQILKLTVSSYVPLLTYATIIGAVISVFVVGIVAFKMRRGKRFMSPRRRMRALMFEKEQKI